MKPIYLAAYHQSRFGKLGALSVPAMIEAAVRGATVSTVLTRG